VLTPFLLLVVASVTSPAPDTIVDLQRGDRIVVEGLAGNLTVSTWSRSAIEVHTGEDEPVSVRRDGSDVRVAGDDRRRRGRSVEASIRVPSWVDLDVRSRALDVSISGVAGTIRVGSVNGDVRVDDAGGDVDVTSITGEIDITDARGHVRASSQSDDVTLTRVAGPIEVHSGDGDIRLQDVSSSSVRAEAQDGDVFFDGTIAPKGDYGFFLHDGDATISVPSTASAHVSVSTFDGEFRSDFTVKVERFTSGRQFAFDIGDGSARVQIEVFDGDIRLQRRGSE
jgi:Toastrack DUF4097